LGEVGSEIASITPASVERAARDLVPYLAPAPNERVVVILSGANITDEVVIRVLKSP
jgi:hypothetical protein